MNGGLLMGNWSLSRSFIILYMHIDIAIHTVLKLSVQFNSYFREGVSHVSLQIHRYINKTNCTCHLTFSSV